MGSVSRFGQACLFFALAGIGASAMWVPNLTIVQRWFALRKRGMALGILSTGSGLGLAVMGSVFPMIVEHWNWRYCWYFLGIAALSMVLVNAFFLRSKPEDMKLRPWGDELDCELTFQALRETEKPKGRYREILTTSRFWKIGLSYTFIAGSLYGVTTYMVDYARYNLGFSYEKASFLATVHGVGQVLGVLAILPLSDYFGRRRTIVFSNLILSATIGNIILSGTHEAWLLASVTLFGAFFGATFPIYGACGGDYFRKDILGTVVGAWTPFYGLGIIGSNRLAGYLRDVTGSFGVPFVVMILSALVASVLMFSVRYHPNGKSPPKRGQG
jgi:OFA family oxalate/formate antiporter-like MFS transporter